MVRDIVNRQLIAHFRAHTSPLLALQFDPSGTMLVTASLHGHNVHIFHICPRQCASDKPASQRPTASAVHLFRLSRGVTPALIGDISFSQSGAWLAVSSARGTTHGKPCCSRKKIKKRGLRVWLGKGVGGRGGCCCSRACYRSCSRCSQYHWHTNLWSCMYMIAQYSS